MRAQVGCRRTGHACLKKEGFLEELGSRNWQIVGPEARYAGWVQIRLITLGENNSKDTNALLNCLSDTVFTKVAHCKSAKEIWDKIQNIYEGDTKVKEAKIQTYRG
jgi:hypothetical protein